MLPSVTLANNGAALATWQRSLGDTGIVEAASFSAGGAEGPATQLSQPSDTEQFPDLAGTAKGDAVAVWGQVTDNSNGAKIQAARFCRRPGNANGKHPPCRSETGRIRRCRVLGVRIGGSGRPAPPVDPAAPW